jgi:hypothetical protein
MKHTHLSDDRLVELAMNECPSGDEQHHLGACTACEQRRVETARLLDESFISAREDADAAFTAERLARQQSRIFERLALEDRPARVIAFPAAPEGSPIMVPRTRPASRWVAAAAVAGLVVGVAAGRLAPETFRALGGGSQVAVAAPPPVVQTTRSAAATLSDEQLLGEIELAVYRSGGQSLLALDELTPRAWEVR